MSSANVSALLLCSGGLDSLSLMRREVAAGRTLTALFFDYGQLNAADERAAAQAACVSEGVELITASLRGAFPPSGLTDEAESFSYMEGKSRFFLPARNAVLITTAVSWAMRKGCGVILTGSVRADRTHLDSGEPFGSRMAELVSLCSGGAVTVEYPLAAMRKAEVLREAAALGDAQALLAGAWSCYYPRSSPKVRRFAWGEGCGSCLSCRGRRAAMAGLEP